MLVGLNPGVGGGVPAASHAAGPSISSLTIPSIATVIALALATLDGLLGTQTTSAQVAGGVVETIAGSGQLQVSGGFPAGVGRGPDYTLATFTNVTPGATARTQTYDVPQPNPYGRPNPWMEIRCPSGGPTGIGGGQPLDSLAVIEWSVPCESATLVVFSNGGGTFDMSWSVTYRQRPATGQLPFVAAAIGLAPDPVAEFSRDPVHTRWGSFTYTHSDANSAGRAPTPGFQRSYASTDVRLTALGPGWTHNYAARLTNPGDAAAPNDVIVVAPGGRSDRYRYVATANAIKSYAPPAAMTPQLIGNANGTYTITHPDQSSWSFDAAGKLTLVTDRFGNQSVLGYNSSNQLASISDAAARGSLSLAYDATTGRLLSVTDWMGRAVTYGYDPNGRLGSVTDRNNQVTRYAYDGFSQRLTSITDATGHAAVSMTYDSQGRVQYQWDVKGANASGQRTEFAYGVPDAQGNVITTVIYPPNAPGEFASQQVDTYNNLGQAVQHVSKPGATETLTETYAYDTNGFRSSVTDARGNPASLCYDVSFSGMSVAGSRGNLTRTISPPPVAGGNPLVTLIKYDARNNVVQTVAPKGVSNGASVTCSTDLSASVNSSGLYATDLVYDASGAQLLSTTRKYTDPDNGLQTATTRFAYADAANPGLVTMVTSPRGNQTTLTYNGSGAQAGLLQSVSDPLGRATSYGYDAVGRRTSLTDPLSHGWSFQYDNEDRLTHATAPAPVAGGASLTTSASFDAVGNRLSLTDANGQTTRYQYDERDSLKEVDQSATQADPTADPNKIVTAYSYDNLGNLVRVDRAAGTPSEEIVDYAYDGLNRVRKETQYPQGGWPGIANGSTSSQTLVTQTTYDPDGNRQTLTDPLGQLSTFAYDAVNRLTSISYSNAASGTATTPNVSHSYDANSNRASTADGTGSTTYGYDELDRLLSVASPGPRTVGYRYDVDGNRRKIIYPDGTAVNYTFDKASQLQSLQDWANHPTSYGYFADVLLNTVTNPNGTTGQFTYDNARRLTQVANKEGSNTISQHTYSVLDKVGNRKQLDEVLPQLGAPGPIGGGSMLDVAASPMHVGSDQQAAAFGAAPLAQVPPSSQSPTPPPSPTSSAVSAAVGTSPSRTTTAAMPTRQATVPATAILAATGTPASVATRAPTTVANGTPTTVAPSSTPVAVGTLVAGLVPLALVDQSADHTHSYAFGAAASGALVEAMPRDGQAGIQLTDSSTSARLSVEFLANPSARQTAGSSASAAVGSINVEWSVDSDRIQETLVLSNRPTDDRVSFIASARALRLFSDGVGGLLARGRGGITAFHFLAPTVKDAKGRVSTAKLVLDSTPATIRLDPTFAATATYPLTIQRTTVLGSAAASEFPVQPLGANQSVTGTSRGYDDLGVSQASRVVDQPEQTQLEVAATGLAQALPSTSDPWVWGNNWTGQLANGMTNDGGPTPNHIAGLGPVSALTGGNYHMMALKTDGTLWGWGDNGNGEIGNPAAATNQTTPIQVVGPGGSGFLTGVMAVAAGQTHTLAVKSDGTLWAWGDSVTFFVDSPAQAIEVANKLKAEIDRTVSNYYQGMAATAIEQLKTAQS